MVRANTDKLQGAWPTGVVSLTTSTRQCQVQHNCAIDFIRSFPRSTQVSVRSELMDDLNLRYTPLKV